MKLEEQVVSLELAKQLNKLGVKQKSLWCWVELCLGHHTGSTHRLILCSEATFLDTIIPAYTSAELGEMLKVVDNFLFVCPLWYGGKKNEWYVGGEYNITADTEANARAKMLIYLNENKLI